MECETEPSSHVGWSPSRSNPSSHSSRHPCPWRSICVQLPAAPFRGVSGAAQSASAVTQVPSTNSKPLEHSQVYDLAPVSRHTPPSPHGEAAQSSTSVHWIPSPAKPAGHGPQRNAGPASVVSAAGMSLHSAPAKHGLPAQPSISVQPEPLTVPSPLSPRGQVHVRRAPSD